MQIDLYIPQRWFTYLLCTYTFINLSLSAENPIFCPMSRLDVDEKHPTSVVRWNCLNRKHTMLYILFNNVERARDASEMQNLFFYNFYRWHNCSLRIADAKAQAIFGSLPPDVRSFSSAHESIHCKTLSDFTATKIPDNQKIYQHRPCFSANGTVNSLLDNYLIVQ